MNALNGMLIFTKATQDWELEAITEFYPVWNYVSITKGTIDTMIWSPSKDTLPKKEKFTVISFYKFLIGLGMPTFPWKRI